MSKFKAPWKLNRILGFRILPINDHKAIAYCLDEKVANLIVSAPELLAALEECLLLLPANDELDKAFKADLQDLIKRAKGE